MTTLNLACRAGHAFEAWFHSRVEFARQHEAGMVACPWCGTRDIERRPSVPHVVRSRDGGASSKDVARDVVAKGESRACDGDFVPSSSMRSFARSLRAFHRYIERTCDDVGERFPEEARRLHEERIAEEEGGGGGSSKRASRKKGREARRGIFGQATLEEARALDEEGISVAPMPPLPSRHN